ncbi:hypothetical protein RND71_005035 [Anisodus tanguticus]|uniref:Uncharacterized protein n=1 Tax=Anisodus tanguticus TaxID=243964 RepID=A0AAE1SRN0_9SOLA|nr:hypothetical protein RND71_005035 [Anisodus tanguticus]
MAEKADCQKYPSIPSNYISIAQLQERWLKEKQKKQQEKEEKKHPKNPVGQNDKKHRNHISNGSIHSGKNLQKHQSGKSWREVGLIAKESKVKEVKITAQVVEEGEKNKKKGYFRNRIARVERDGKEGMAKVSTIDVAVVSVENSGIESSKGKNQWNGKNKEVKKVTTVNKEVEEVANVCTVEVVGENKVDREIAGQKHRVGFWGKKNRVGKVRDKADSAEQSGQERNAENEEVSVDVKERTHEKVRVKDTFCGYGDKEVEEVATIWTVEVVEENKVEREIAGQIRRVGFRGKTNSWIKIGDRVGEVSNKIDSAEQSGQEHNEEKEEVSVDMKERTNEKVRTRGAFHAYRDKEVKVVGESNVDREIGGEKLRFGFRGKKNGGRKTGDRVGEVSDKVDSVDQSGKEDYAEQEEVLVDVKERANEKVIMRGAFRAYGDTEVEEVVNVCTVEMVEENKVDKEFTGQKCRVGFRRKMGDRVGEVSDKADSAEQSGQKRNAEKEKVSVDVKERTNEKVRVRSAFRAYGGKSKDVPLVDSDAGLKMNIERDLGDLSLSDRRYGHGRSRRYEPRKMLKQRDNSFVWVKKGESSNSNVAENESQVDFSSQSTSRSKLCSQ